MSEIPNRTIVDRFALIENEPTLSAIEKKLLQAKLKQADPLADAVAEYFDEIGWLEWMRLLIYHLWKYISYLSGIDSSFWVENQREAKVLFAMLIKANLAPDQNSKLLATAFLQTQVDVLVSFGWPRVVALHTCRAFLWLFQGRTNAQALGVPFSPIIALEPLIIALNFTRRSLAKRKNSKFRLTRNLHQHYKDTTKCLRNPRKSLMAVPNSS